MKHLRNKRKDVTFGRKFKYLASAIDYMSLTSVKQRTDVIGLACQFSSQPKLKREDFGGMLDMTLGEIMDQMGIKS